MLWFWLFYEFFKTGLFAVGGGLATLPFLYDISERTGWFTTEDIANMVAVSESTPGPLGVNMATFAGYQTEGVLGGIFTTLSLTMPALIVVTAIYFFMKRFSDNDAVQRIFYGLRPASTALIAAAGLEVAKIALLDLPRYAEDGGISSIFRWDCILLAAVILFLMKRFRWHPVIYILISAAAGVAFHL